MSTGERSGVGAGDAWPAAEGVLAAVERAARHRGDARASVPLSAIRAHLAIAPRSASARTLAALLDALCSSAALARSRRRGVERWALTDAGRERLASTRGGAGGELPESPQHAAWRRARTAAAQEGGRFARRLDALLDEARALRASGRSAPSDAWLELGEELQRACRLFACARHCLYEWPEPDDARADVDRLSGPGDDHLDARALARRRALRVGRRNVRLWHEEL